MFDTSKAQNLITQLLKVSASPLHDHDLQAVVVVQVNVGRCQDSARSVVLRFNQFL